MHPKRTLTHIHTPPPIRQSDQGVVTQGVTGCYMVLQGVTRFPTRARTAIWGLSEEVGLSSCYTALHCVTGCYRACEDLDAARREQVAIEVQLCYRRHQRAERRACARARVRDRVVAQPQHPHVAPAIGRWVRDWDRVVAQPQHPHVTPAEGVRGAILSVGLRNILRIWRRYWSG
eukprot:432754-Pyramimonas_sp.AAC.1